MKFVILFLFASCSLAHATAKKDLILGGQDVQPADPVRASTVAVYTPSPSGQGGSLCTGTLIRKDVALTAAHCIQPGGPKPELIFGRDLHSPAALRRDGTAVAVDPKWRTHQGRGMDQGDVALVKFAGGLPAGYHQARQVTSDSAIRNGDIAELAGYGVNDARTHAGAGRLRKAQVRIINSRPGESEMIMDQSHGQGACHGDSGGPAFVKQGKGIALAGLTNRGYPDNAPDDCAHQVVYTKVPAYRRWIAASEKKWDSPKRAPAAMSHVIRKRQRAHHGKHGPAPRRRTTKHERAGSLINGKKGDLRAKRRAH